jgi:hypothetical protein
MKKRVDAAVFAAFRNYDDVQPASKKATGNAGEVRRRSVGVAPAPLDKGGGR